MRSWPRPWSRCWSVTASSSRRRSRRGDHDDRTTDRPGDRTPRRRGGRVHMTPTVAETRLPFPLVARGKVRDVYDVGGDRLLMVATDRISAFDVVLPQPIPHKGEVLTLITAWWLARLED